MRAASLWVLVLFIFLALRLVYNRLGFAVPCPLRSVTGLFCPGCGTFRALGALMGGNILQATRYNALILVFLPTLLVMCGRDTIRYIHDAKPTHTSRMEMILSIGAVIVSLIYTIARNLPFFATLQPTSL